MTGIKTLRVCGKVMHWCAVFDGMMVLRSPEGNWCAYVTKENQISVCQLYRWDIGRFDGISDIEDHAYATKDEALQAAMVRLIELGFVDPIDYVRWNECDK